MTESRTVDVSKLHHFQKSFAKSLPRQEPKAEALFYSVRAALAFAYAIMHFDVVSSPNCNPSDVAATNSISRLSPLEKRAQGALIRKAAEQRLRGLDVAVTFAFYGAGELRSAAIREVGNEATKTIRNRALGLELTKRYFNRNTIHKTQDDIAREYGISQQTVSRLDKLVGDEIDAMRHRTESQLEQLFVSTGISSGL